MKRYCVLLVGGMFLAVAAICVGQVPPSTLPPPPPPLPPIHASGEILQISKTDEPANTPAVKKNDVELPVSSQPPIVVDPPPCHCLDGRSQGMVKRNVEPSKTDEVKEKSVEELLSRLDAIKGQQEELDKAKKETVTLLKEKLKQQKQRLQNLGVSVEEEAVRPPVSGYPQAPARIPSPR